MAQKVITQLIDDLDGTELSAVKGRLCGSPWMVRRTTSISPATRPPICGGR